MRAEPAYRFRLDMFEGPLDVLLRLIEAEQMDIHQIPVARLTDQYLSFLASCDSLPIDEASGFLVMAATLVAMKARSLFPQATPADGQTEGEDALLSEEELSRRLLEYRAYRDAAQLLAQRASAHVDEVTRLPLSLSEFRTLPTVAQAIGNITLADLAAALAAVVERARPPLPVELRRDDEPLEVRVTRLLRIIRGGPTTFTALVDRGSRRDIVGVFLALLELLRQGAVRCEQERMYGEIWITATT